MALDSNISIRGRVRRLIRDRRERISRKIRSLSSQQQLQKDTRYQPDSRFMDLPLDLTLCIFDLLEAHDATALSLACKGLYYHLFADARTQVENTTSEGRLKVQTMLEKDLPHDQVYCPFCEAFHPLDEEYRRHNCREHQRPNHSSFVTHTPGNQSWKLSYLDARHVKNAVLFQKPGARQQLERLGYEHWVWADEATGQGWRKWWDPKVVGGELILQVAATNTNHSAAAEREEFTYSVCKHVSIHAQYPHIWADGSATSRMCYHPSGELNAGTCRTCSADYQVAMKRVADGGGRVHTGWVFGILSWHRLGSLRSPSDPVWARCAGEYVTPETRRNEGFCHGDGGDHENCRHEEFWTKWGRPDDRHWEHIVYCDGWEQKMAALPAGPEGNNIGAVQEAWSQDE